ncbi:MAG: tetratricopeptide repeat protein [Saprospiraceae bacterium]|nr:tetratricopeptide repeat protein [Lewinellaceae bacterium]
MTVKRKQSNKPAAKPAWPYGLWLWLIFFAGSLFFIPQCLDRYLVPRFFLLSALLIGAIWSLRKYWKEQIAAWQLHSFDVLLLVWYGWNVASISWAFSWSEAIFYAQKVLLLFAVYWLVRQALLHNEAFFRKTMARVTQALTLVVSVLLLIQLGQAISEHGLDNQRLYDYADGVFGNKGLATDFVFFLLVLNVLFEQEFKNKRLFWAATGLLALFILVLQTRTVYLATAAAGLFYLSARVFLEPPFRPVFLKKIVPVGILAIVTLAGLLAWKGQGTSLAERLNPANYLESASALERRFVWYKTGELNKNHFWLGVGNGNWKHLFPSQSIEGAYRLQEKNIVMTRVHNDYLEVRSEMGIVGVVLFILLFGAAFGAGLLALHEGPAPPVRHDLVVLMAGLLGYCVIQYFDFPRERIEMQALLAFLFAYLAFHSRSVWGRGPGVSLGKQQTVFIGLLLAGLMLNSWIGWNRIQGEIHTVKTMQAQSKGNFAAVQREAAAASNLFYEYNDVALPLQWYEGIAFYQMNNIPEAVAAFEEAYRLNPWAFQVINNYGSALVRAEQYTEAIALFEKALAINPRYEEGKFNMAYCLYALGEFDQALEWLHRVDTIPNPQTPQERQKNQAVLQQKAGLETAISKQQK